MKKYIFLILLTIFITGCSYSLGNTDTYGNSDKEVMRYLNKSDVMGDMGKDNLQIIDTMEIEDSKIIGFMSDTAQGILIYQKDENNNYTIKFSTVDSIWEDSMGLRTYEIEYGVKDSIENDNNGYVVLSNGNNSASKVELIINNKHTYNKSLELGKPSMAMFEGISTEDITGKIYTEYRYFDMDNNELLDVR